ncbi:MAG TPA: hypothetical protein VJ140_14025 [Actinomycetota bacterium]|nr:hypothetical protein [Actinomycetota bacterium]
METTTEQTNDLRALAKLRKRTPLADRLEGVTDRAKRKTIKEADTQARTEAAEITRRLIASGLTNTQIEAFLLPRDRRAQLTKLGRLHAARTEMLEKWRTAPTDFPALLELVVFRGVSTMDTGARLGVSREAIARRIRPTKARYGLTGRGLAVRAKAEAAGLRRPYAKLGEDALIEKAREEMAKAEADTDAEKDRADQLLLEMAEILVELSETKPKVADTVIADAMGITTMTVYRLKRQAEELAAAAADRPMAAAGS